MHPEELVAVERDARVVAAAEVAVVVAAEVDVEEALALAEGCSPKLLC